MKRLCFILGLLVGATGLWCTKNDNIAGGTNTGNARGQLVHADGTPAAGVVVQFYPVGSTPTEIVAKATSSQTETDQNGQFDMALDSGLYNLVAETESSAAYAESIDASAGANITDTLKSFGSLTGQVLLQNNDDVRTVFILLLGTNTWAVPGVNGKFTLSRLAEGAYNARILTTLDNYYPLDIRLAVTPGEDNTLEDPIVLPVKTLATPTGLTATPLPGARIQLTWNPVGGAIVYEVYRSAADTPAFSLIAKTLDTTVVDDDSTSTGTDYGYIIRATNGYVLSSLSDTAAALTTPAAPESVWAKAIEDSSILLKWNRVPSATSYKIFRRWYNQSDPESIGVAVETTFTATGADYRAQCWYWVKAMNQSGDSPFPYSQQAPIPLGTILYSRPFYVMTDSTAVISPNDPLTVLFEATGEYIGIQANDVFTISANDTFSRCVVASAVTNPLSSQVATLADLANRTQSFLGTLSAGTTVTLSGNGSLRITAGAADINYFQITSNRSGVSDAFMPSSSFVTAGSSVTTGGFCKKTRLPALPTHLINILYDEDYHQVGGPTGLEEGAIININGAVGGVNVAPGEVLYSTGTSTLQSLFDAVRVAFDLPLYDGTPDSNLSVTTATEDLVVDRYTIPAGAIVIRGQPGMKFELTNVSIQAGDPNMLNSATPTRFNANMGFIQARAARE